MEFRDLKAQYAALKPQIDAAIAEVIAGSAFISGKKVDELEKKLAEYVGVKHCVSCASGTDALVLTLSAWGVKKGDAVFVPDFTFFATAEAAALCGATPIFVDIEKGGFNMSAKSLEKAVAKVESEGKLVPKVVIPVDLFGVPADYPEIEKIARRHGMLVLEDAAQGFGGAIGEKRAGSFGNAAATSFFPAKPLGCYGDGGAVFTNDDRLEKLLRSLCVHGRGKNKYDNVRLGFNSRLDTLQAAVLIPKLDALCSYELKSVNAAAEKYSGLLGGFVETPKVPRGYFSSFAQYSILLKDSVQRKKVREALAAAGVPTGIYYPKPLHAQMAFAFLKNSDEDFPVASDSCKRVLALPIHPYIKGETIEWICEIIKKAL